MGPSRGGARLGMPGTGQSRCSAANDKACNRIEHVQLLNSADIPASRNSTSLPHAAHSVPQDRYMADRYWEVAPAAYPPKPPGRHLTSTLALMHRWRKRTSSKDVQRSCSESSG